MIYRLDENHQIHPIKGDQIDPETRIVNEEHCRELVAAWEMNNRIVKQEYVGNIWISTVFLVIDHSFGRGPPVLFETMIFGLPDEEEYQTRCCTWDEALEMHKTAVEYVKTCKPLARPINSS